MKVAKFGGSSLASAEQIAKVCDIVLSDPERRVIVVSAPGKRHAEDTKVTDLLIACADAKGLDNECAQELERVAARFEEIRLGLGLSDELAQRIGADLQGRIRAGSEHPDRLRDSMKAAGEDNCAKLVAEALGARGADARYVNPRHAGLLLSDEPGNAQVLPESYDNLSSLAESDAICVFPGFFGYTRDGDIATFPRGGSDITGAILAAALKAELYENFTDVDSVCAADPRITPDARPITELTYREMRELSYAGFDVFQEEALIPVIHAGIPVCIKNTNRPEAPGTRISPTRKVAHGEIMGIASKDGFCTLFVSKYMMNRETGFGRRLLQIVEEEGLSFEHMPSGIDDVSVIVRADSITPKAESRVIERVKRELAADVVRVERGLGLIMVVGEGMCDTPGIACRVTGALAREGVNIEMLNQGGSEVSLMIGLREGDIETAVRALHHEFSP